MSVISGLCSSSVYSVSKSLQNYSDAITNRCKEAAFRAASYLTDPICKSRECYYMASIADELYPANASDTIGKITACLRKYALFTGFALYGALATLTTLPGIALRSLTAAVSSEPFIYRKGYAEEKKIGDSFSLLSWNVCFVPGGYSITDGGVLSYFYRQDKITAEILKADADVVCLYETFDTGSAADLATALQEKYPHIYYDIAPRAIGSSSGIFVASKFPLEDFSVELFPEDTLVGRTKYSNKALVSFSLENKVRVFTTHAQHAEEPEFPTDIPGGEIECNRRQMEIIIDKVKAIYDQNLPVIICGDLNVPRENLEAVPGLRLVSQNEASEDASRGITFLDDNKENKIPTWGGDASCARFYDNKRVSGALELDYVLARNVKKLVTKIGPTNFNPEVISADPNVTSDHNPLTATITLR